MIKKAFLWLILFGFTCTLMSQTDSLKQTLTIGIKTAPPFIYENEFGSREGISIFLINKLAENQNLNINYKSYDELNHLIHAVSKGEVDMSVNPVTVTAERIESIDFSQPFVISKLAIAAKPQQKSQTLLFLKNIFSLQFLKAVLLLFLVIFIFGLVIWAFERNQNPHFENNGHGLFSGIWFSAVTMTTVGYGDKAPTTTGGKIFTLIWMFTAIIIISGFTASIAASLTVNNLENGIESIQDLQKIEVGTIEASSSEIYLHNHQVAVSTFNSVDEGLKALSENEIKAFVYDEPLLRFKLTHGDYDPAIQVLPYTFNTQYYSLSFPKNSTLMSQLNPELLKVIKTGEWNEMLEKYGLIE